MLRKRIVIGLLVGIIFGVMGLHLIVTNVSGGCPYEIEIYRYVRVVTGGEIALGIQKVTTGLSDEIVREVKFAKGAIGDIQKAGFIKYAVALDDFSDTEMKEYAETYLNSAEFKELNNDPKHKNLFDEAERAGKINKMPAILRGLYVTVTGGTHEWNAFCKALDALHGTIPKREGIPGQSFVKFKQPCYLCRLWL